MLRPVVHWLSLTPQSSGFRMAARVAWEMVLRWRHRSRSRASLRDLPPHMLRDIGLSAAEAESEAAKAFWRA